MAEYLEQFVGDAELPEWFWNEISPALYALHEEQQLNLFTNEEGYDQQVTPRQSVSIEL